MNGWTLVMKHVVAAVIELGSTKKESKERKSMLNDQSFRFRLPQLQESGSHCPAGRGHIGPAG